MIGIKRLVIVTLFIMVTGSVVQASILDQVIYNVVGQASNAAGARLGDEIYYGSSKRKVKHRSRRKVKHRSKHRSRKAIKHRTKHKAAISTIPKMTDEKKIQKTLESLGFYKGKIDGEVNSFETRSAIKEMNKAYSISNNASLQPEVKDMLIYLGTLFGFDRQLIASGTDKKTKNRKIQTALKIHGYYHDKIDGLAGSGTRSCISNYKNANGMTPNGALDFEEEYRLVSSAKEKNDKNMEESLLSLKSFGHKNMVQQTTLQTQPQANTTQAKPQQNQQVVQQQQTPQIQHTQASAIQTQSLQKQVTQQTAQVAQTQTPNTATAPQMQQIIK